MRARIALVLALALACGRTPEVPVETRMQEALSALRTALAKFENDNGHGPRALDELVPRYLPRIPADPVTQSAATWRLTTEETVQPSADFSASAPPPSEPEIVAVHSGAPGTDRAGKRWADY